MSKKNIPQADDTEEPVFEIRELNEEAGESKSPVSSNSTFKYIGPDYKNGLWCGRHLIKPKGMTREQAEALVARFPVAAKYFQF